MSFHSDFNGAVKLACYGLPNSFKFFNSEFDMIVD